MPNITCPHCHATVEIDREHFGLEVECGNCSRIIPAESTRPAGQSSPGFKSKRDWGDSDRYDDDDDDRGPRRRRRRSRRYRDDFDESDYESAADAVHGPAVGLISVGWIGVVLYVLGGIGFCAMGLIAKNDMQVRNPNQNQENFIVLFMIGCYFAIVGGTYSFLIAWGGHRLKSMKSYAFPMTSAIMAITSIILFHPCNPLNWFMVGMGIWTLVAVNRPDVKWAIRQNQNAG